MKLVVSFFLCFCVSGNFAHTIGLLDKLATGFSQAGQGIKCGLHNVGNRIHQHQHGNDPCHPESVQEVQTNNLQYNNGRGQVHNTDYNYNRRQQVYYPEYVYNRREQVYNPDPSVYNRRDQAYTPEYNYNRREEVNTPQYVSSTKAPVIDVRGNEISSTESTAVTVPGGRRIIGVKRNCGPGYRDDGHGNCREEF